MKMNQKEISALIVCHNEAKVIERCLLSLYKVVDEIILIHDGPCSDDTLKIAREYTNRIYEMKEHKGIGESWYIKGFKLCKYEWILRIDADEYLSDELQNTIKILVKNTTCDAFSFVWPMWDGKKYISYKALRKNFLFRKSAIGFIDKFHYPIKVNGQICNSNFIVHHKPNYNNWTEETFNKKQKVWAKLQAKDHLVPVEDREIMNLDIKDLKNEQEQKNLVYRYPLVIYVSTFLLHLKQAFSGPSLFFDRGFWILANFSSKYSFEVAKNVNRLRTQEK